MAVVRKQDLIAASARRADRQNFDAQVGFRARHGRCQVKVRDISTHGARIAAIHLLKQGDTFFLTIPSLEPIEAKVAWADQFELGCEFTRPLYPAVLDALLARLAGR